MPEERVRCQVCDALNSPGEKFCEVCGVELKIAAKQGSGADVDNLLQELIETKGEAKEAKPGLGIEEDIVDELLDSLLVEGPGAKPAKGAVQQFECPICGADVNEDAAECPKCHTAFAPMEAEAEAEVVPDTATPEAEPETETVPEAQPEAEPEEVAEEPAPVRPVPVSVPIEETEGAGEAPAVTLSETEVSPVRARSGRLIDYVVVGTILGMFAIFVGFRMYSLEAILANPASIGLFMVVTVGGLGGSAFLFRLTTSAITRGDRLVKEGRFDDAIALYDRAIRMGSRPASAWTSKGVAMKRLAKYQDALDCHNVALKIDPKNEIAWCNKGDIYFRLGKIKKAVECYDKAIELRPRYAIAWNNRGAAYAKAGKYEEARRCHDRAVRLRPRYIAAWLNLGEVLARLGDRPAAEKCLQRARSLTA